jgi:hypothetical protein
MQTNLIPVAVARQHNHVTPENHEALKTLRAADFRLEAEFYALDIEGRFELAEELRATFDDLGDAQVDELARVVNDLEDISGEDFSQWETRAAAASRVRTVIRSLEREAAHA